MTGRRSLTAALAAVCVAGTLALAAGAALGASVPLSVRGVALDAADESREPRSAPCSGRRCWLR